MADDFLRRAHQFFLSRGYPPHAAAALAANAVAESGGNTRAVHDQGTGVGIYGFRDPKPGEGRKTELFSFAKARGLDPYAESTQLEFADHELKTSEKASGDALKASKDYRQATNAVVGYLRPQGYTADNPAAAHNYAGRWNTGAALAGVQPIVGPTMAAAGSADTPVTEPAAPTGGLLAMDTTKLDALRAEQAATATAQATATKEKEQDQAFAELQKTGMGLLAEGQKIQPGPQFLTPPPPLPAGQPVNYDFLDAPAVDVPDFQKMMMQQRLQRRV
jgi:hypothetical protein